MTVQYRNRRTGELETERVFRGESLRFLYGGPIGRLLCESIVSSRLFSRFYGWLQRRPASRRKIPEFIRSLGIDAGEAERAPEDYASLDDFFTRRLKAGSRPVDSDPDRLVTPADGRVRVIPRLSDTWLSVKGSRVRLAGLLQDEALAPRYADGSAALVRLAAADYHRFHFPESGDASEPQRIGGRLHSVHPIALDAGAPSFENQRTWTRLETRRFGSLLQIEVGAMAVGTIEQAYRAGAVRRGQEKGFFRFGGSAIVLLVEPGRLRFDEDLVRASEAGVETLVRMGEPIARRAEP
jgi:phosphatidylserine decarboxylase